MTLVLAVLAKAPVPGRVKTRLCPPLTPVEAAAVQEASLRDVIIGAGGVASELVLVYDPAPGAEEHFRGAFPRLERIAQGAGDLGERMAAALDLLFARGADGVMLIGGDAPTLPRRNLEAAAAAVGAAKVVFGPTRDGGYYLVGIDRSSWPRARRLFAQVPWSTERVLAVSLERAAALGLSVRLLEPWYDIDRGEDLRAALRDASPDSAIGRLLAGWRERLEEGE